MESDGCTDRERRRVYHVLPHILSTDHADEWANGERVTMPDVVPKLVITQSVGPTTVGFDVAKRGNKDV